MGVGVCLGHKKPKGYAVMFVSGASATKVNGKAMATVTSIGVNTCGHVSMAVSGSPLTTATNGQKAHRVGDAGVSGAGGAYTAASGSPSVKSD